MVGGDQSPLRQLAAELAAALNVIVDLLGAPHPPIERTLLTGGLVEAGCQSLTLGERVETPHLAEVAYQPAPLSNFGFE